MQPAKRQPAVLTLAYNSDALTPGQQLASWVKAQPCLICSDALQVVHIVLPATAVRWPAHESALKLPAKSRGPECPLCARAVQCSCLHGCHCAAAEHRGMPKSATMCGCLCNLARDGPTAKLV